MLKKAIPNTSMGMPRSVATYKSCPFYPKPRHSYLLERPPLYNDHSVIVHEIKRTTCPVFFRWIL